MKSFFLTLVAVMVLAACQKAPSGNSSTERLAAGETQQLECSATAGEWLPTTPKPSPDAAPDNPEDCFFYRSAWQNFLVATVPDAADEPAFLKFPNLSTIFGTKVAGQEFKALRANSLGVAVRDVQRPNNLPTNPSRVMSIAEGVRQAGGLFGLVIDVNGNPIFYSIHVNDEYAAFIKDNGLTTKAAVESDPDLEFPPGVAEYKAAWAIVPLGAPADPNYIQAEADIPNLVQDAKGVLRVGNGTHKARLKLIAFHIAFVIKDHPEFIWATFDHVQPDGTTDVAPSAAGNDDTSAIIGANGITYTLFATGATRASANVQCPVKVPCDPTKDFPVFDAARQSFPGQRTSIFREFPASKSDRGLPEDRSVIDLNTSMRGNLAPTGGKRDVRANYRLVGATWLEQPRDGHGRKGDFAVRRSFGNLPGTDTEDRDKRMVAGEDALSSTAMESFTQRDSPSCFSCHDTNAVKSDEDRSVILKPTRLNVSHVISRFLSEPK